MATKTFAEAVSAFGAAAKAKLSNPAVTGAPEDQLRNPLETLLCDLAELGGMPPTAVQLVGEGTCSSRSPIPSCGTSGPCRYSAPTRIESGEGCMRCWPGCVRHNACRCR